MCKIIYITAVLFLVTSCDFFKPTLKPEAVARANKSFLYKEELENLVPKGALKEDSITIVRNYIDRWATQSLLIDAAEINLSHDKKIEFDKLIQQYKIDLYTRAYIEEIIQRTVDTVVTQTELVKYYDENKENFRTINSLVKLRFVNLAKDNPKFETIKTKFLNYNKEDEKILNTYSIQFNSFALNDSVWVDMDQIYGKLPFITPDNKNDYIQNGKTVQYSDSLNVFLVKVNKVLDKNEVSPFEYVKPTLKKIILNKRQLELIKKFEKDITNDAIKNNIYEIYN